MPASSVLEKVIQVTDVLVPLVIVKVRTDSNPAAIVLGENAAENVGWAHTV